jgi:hypothetical protein
MKKDEMGGKRSTHSIIENHRNLIVKSVGKRLLGISKRRCENTETGLKYRIVFWILLFLGTVHWWAFLESSDEPSGFISAQHLSAKCPEGLLDSEFYAYFDTRKCHHNSQLKMI